MIKISKGKNKSLENLAIEHYFKIKDIIKNGINKNTHKRRNPKDRYFYNWLSQSNYSNLKRVIISTPKEISKIISEINLLINNSNINSFCKLNNKNKLTSTNFGKDVSKLFNYHFWRSKDETEEWIEKEFDIPVCPYCNRQYTTTIKTKKRNNKIEKKVLFQFDHYYSKIKYPYLALSFYNLIPSCSICNSQLKGVLDFSLEKYLHPYNDSFNDIKKFKIVGTKGIDYFYDRNLSFTIILKNNDKKLLTDDDKERAKNTAEVFKIEDIYNKHRDYVFEIFQKHLMYNETYIDSLFKQYEGNIFNSKEELIKLIFGNYININDIGRRPLAKLTIDILEDIGVKY